MSKITLALRADDAEAWLQMAAYEAALYGALSDFITKRTYNVRYRGYGETLDDSKKRWQQRFLLNKRRVEAFGVEYEPTSEEEALTVHIPMKNEKRKSRVIAGIGLYRSQRWGARLQEPAP